MDFKKFSMAVGGSFIVMSFLGWLWHRVILGNFYMENISSSLPEPNVLIVLLGFLILAVLMAWMYPHGYKGGSALIEGLRFGVIIGLLWFLPINVIMIGVVGKSGTLVVVDGLWRLVEQGIGGIVIGYIYGSKSS
jgi:hypothetical protein